MVDSQCTDITM